jgi:hypothetical protein
MGTYNRASATVASASPPRAPNLRAGSTTLPGPRADAAVLGSRAARAMGGIAVAAMPSATVETPRAHGARWFGVFVAWLATATLGAAVAASVPAHHFARVHAKSASAIGWSGASNPAAISGATAAKPGVGAIVTAAPPLVRFSDLPLAPMGGAASLHARAQPTIRVALPAAPPAAPTRPAQVEKAVSEENEADPAKQALPSSPPDVRLPPPPDVQATPPPDVQATRPPDVRSPPPDSTFAAGSLEDLMRQEVDKEQRVHKR